MGMQERFYELVSGRKTGITAAVLRSVLRLLEVPYRSVVSARNLLYDKRMLPIYRSSMPIISVGNLTLGGTGKSPLVAWLCKFFMGKNLHPGLISRGYGKGTHHVNDEFMEMSHRLPNIPHLQDPNRAEAIQKLLQTEQVDLIILDDAFQHRQVERNIDIAEDMEKEHITSTTNSWKCPIGCRVSRICKTQIVRRQFKSCCKPNRLI